MMSPSSTTTEAAAAVPLNGNGHEYIDMSSASTTTSNKLNYFSMLNLDNPVFCCFLFWTSVLVIKMLLMSLLTALQRFRYKILRLLPKVFIKKVFPNQEDLFFNNIEVQFNDPHVERVRRAHRNDMENILPYFTMALVYVCTNPSATIACNLFRVASVARIVHTLVYAFYPVPQPSRVLAWGVMFVITLYMAADVFANREDLVFHHVDLQFNEPHVERVRRAHRNDMENILPYFTMSLIYISTNPSPTLACNLFRVAAVGRIIHTLVYSFYPVPQPSRVISWGLMFVITLYMAADVALQMITYI